jgi:hypothetical protein
MRLRTKILVGLAVVIFVAAAVFLYLRYSGQINEQNTLKSNISRAETILTTLSTQEKELQDQLSDVETRLAQAASLVGTTQIVFPETAQSIEYHEKFFEIADDCNLAVTSLTASEPSIKNEGTKEKPVSYAVSKFVIRVEGIVPESQSMYAVSEWSKSYINGTVASILKYVDALTTGEYFITASIDSVNMTAPEPLTDARIDEMRIEIRDGLSDEEKKDKTPTEIAELVEKKLIEQIRAELAKAAATIEVTVYTLPR